MSLPTIFSGFGVLLLCLFFCFYGVSSLENVNSRFRAYLKSLTEDERKKFLRKTGRKYPKKFSTAGFYCRVILPSLLCAGLTLIASINDVLAFIVIIISGIGLLYFCLAAITQVKDDDQMGVVMNFAFCPAAVFAVSFAYLGGASPEGYKQLLAGIAIAGGILLLIYLMSVLAFKISGKADEEADRKAARRANPRPSTRVPRRRTAPRHDEDYVDEYEFADGDPDD